MDEQENKPVDAQVPTGDVVAKIEAPSAETPVNGARVDPAPPSLREMVARSRYRAPREQFVMAILPGLCSRGLIKPAELASEAVKIADAVIAELANTEADEDA